MGVVARRVGVSTKTLYRIVAHKAALLKDLVSDLFDQFASELKLQVSDHVEIETGLTKALSFCAASPFILKSSVFSA
jgi:hypothetical protein